MKLKIILFVSLMALWLLLSGHYDMLFIAYGIFSVCTAIYIAHRMQLLDAEQPFQNADPKSIWYLLWLLKEMVVASVTATKAILAPKKLRPKTATIASELTALQQASYANSITLTPGTISLDVDDSHILVHALEAPSLDDLAQNTMQQKIERYL